MPPAPFTVRPATLADAAAIGEIRVRRRRAVGHPEDADPARHQAWVQREVRGAEAGDRLLLVAEQDGRVIAYALTAWFDPPAQAPSNVAPRGWYLLGVVVEPDFRRSGVGRALTEARMRWLAERTKVVFYFRDRDNLASDALHTRWNFRPITDDFWFPGALFPDSDMVLLQARL